MPTDIPSSVYKNAIDLNRYSNSVAKRLVVSYNRIILDSIKELQAINPASYRARDLRTIMGSLKTSLDGWVTEAAKSMKTEVTGLAESQIEFAVLEMMNQIKADVGDIIKDPLVSPQFAEAVVSIDPTELNMVTLSDDLQQKVGGRRGATFQLGAREGALVTLPNGESLEKAFRGLSLRSAERFRLEVQDGLLTGEPIERIVRNLIGRQGGLGFSTEARSAAQIAASGGKLTRLADHQIMALVRTSVNQVSNVATQQTYKANRNITDNFMFVATLDSRTSLVCAANDGKEFSYDDGPVPPLHFNCRSTTVAVPNWKKLKEVYGIERPDEPAMRASPDGLIPAKEKYGDWLYKQRVTDDKGRTIGPGIEQIEALGSKRAIYFNRLAAKSGPDVAIRKLIREDGSEKTLEDLKAQYKLRAITSQQLLKQLSATAPVASVKREDVERLAPKIGLLQGMSAKAPLQRRQVEKAFDLMVTDMDEASENAKKMVRFVRQREIFTSWSAGGREGLDHLIGNKQLERSMELSLARGLKGAKLGISGSKGVLAELKSKKPGKFMNKRLGMVGQRKGVFGFTFQGSDHVVIRSHPYDRALTSKRLTELRFAVRDSIVDSAQGKPRSNVVAGLMKLTKDRKDIYAPTGWLTTLVHELGHQVHYAAQRPKLGYTGGVAIKSSLDIKVVTGTWIPSTYGKTNIMEQFAETFVQYIFDPVALKSASPEAYKWVDDAMKAALEAPY